MSVRLFSELTTLEHLNLEEEKAVMPALCEESRYVEGEVEEERVEGEVEEVCGREVDVDGECGWYVGVEEW